MNVEEPAAIQVTVPGAIRGHVGIAITRYIRQAARDGYTLPPELAALADRLIGDDPVTRRRELTRRRTARWRARRRAQRAA